MSDVIKRRKLRQVTGTDNQNQPVTEIVHLETDASVVLANNSAESNPIISNPTNMQDALSQIDTAIKADRSSIAANTSAAAAAQTKADSAYVLAEGRNKAKVYDTIAAMISAMNDMTADELEVGDNIYIKDINVPDFWVSSIDEEHNEETRTGAELEVLVNAQGFLTTQIGYYVVSKLETSKVALDALTADKLKTARNIALSSDVTGSVDFDGSQNVSIVTTISANAVTTSKIKDANVTAAKLASNSVETAKIKDSNVTTSKIADSNVTTAKIADSNVTTAKIAGEAVTDAKLSKTGVLAQNVSSGVFSVVSVNPQGRVTAGNNLIEFGTAQNNEPSDILATGGLFFELIPE